MVMLPCCVLMSPLSSSTPSSNTIREIGYSSGLVSASMASSPSVETWPYFASHFRMAFNMILVVSSGSGRTSSAGFSVCLPSMTTGYGRCEAWQNSSMSVSEQMMFARPS